jgi:excinuclease ABC subunit B
VQRPTRVLAPHKSLAAQLANEFREFFPDNAVEYFVSYYDYYQPEAYMPSSDTYIEKDSSVNDEIDRLRHATTAALLTRRDVIVVASVSCIYGLGSPEEYERQLLVVRQGESNDQRAILRRLVDMQYDRNDLTLARGTFRVRGDTIEVHPAYDETALRIELFGDDVEQITRVDTVNGERIETLEQVVVYPATHYVVSEERLQKAIGRIESELQEQLARFEKEGKLLEAQRLRMRTQYDLEMMAEVGYCNGLEH